MCPLHAGYTALHMSVLQLKSDFVQLLLLAGASVDIQDNKSGRTALFHAAESKQFTVASALLQKGASVNICSYAGTTAAQVRAHCDVCMCFVCGSSVLAQLSASFVIICLQY